MLIRTGLLIAFSACLLAAAQADKLLPPDLKQVTPRQFNFNDLLSKAWADQQKLTPARPLRLATVWPELNRRCAIPLQNFQVKNRDPAFSLRVLFQAGRDGGIAVPPPVKVCK